MDLWEVYGLLWIEQEKKIQHSQILTPKLCRMICAGLGWTAKDFSKHCGLRPGTISLFLNGGKTHTHTLEKIGAALVNTGRVEIIDSDCVRVKPPNQ
jgi:predicted transcriptional regulator